MRKLQAWPKFYGPRACRLVLNDSLKPRLLLSKCGWDAAVLWLEGFGPNCAERPVGFVELTQLQRHKLDPSNTPTTTVIMFSQGLCPIRNTSCCLQQTFSCCSDQSTCWPESHRGSPDSGGRTEETTGGGAKETPLSDTGNCSQHIKTERTNQNRHWEPIKTQIKRSNHNTCRFKVPITTQIREAITAQIHWTNHSTQPGYNHKSCDPSLQNFTHSTPLTSYSLSHAGHGLWITAYCGTTTHHRISEQVRNPSQWTSHCPPWVHPDPICCVGMKVKSGDNKI